MKTKTTGTAPPKKRPDHIRKLIAAHKKLQAGGMTHAYFELAYTRTTGWMAWITSSPQTEDPGRTVLAHGQDNTPDEACRRALNLLKLKTKLR